MTNQFNTVADLVDYSLAKGNYGYFQRMLSKSGDVSTLSGAINIVYGSLVYDQVNRESNIHAIFRKTGWDRSGFRETSSDLAAPLSGGADIGDSLAAVGDMVPSEVFGEPAFLHNTFDLSLEAGWKANHDDGMDIWDWISQIQRDQHAHGLSKELARSAEAEANDFGANTTDAKNGANGNGLESLDRAIASGAEEGVYGGTYTGTYDLYGGTWDRDAASSIHDSVVVRPNADTSFSTTPQPFQMKGLDYVIDTTENNGANPTTSIILTGRTTRRKLYNELETYARGQYDEASAKLDLGGLQMTSTSQGRDVTFQVRTYQGRPIIADKSVASNGTSDWDANSANGGTGSPHIYVIDSTAIHIKTGFPTLYVDGDNPIYRGEFSTKALYLSCEQLFPTRANVHGKVRDIAA